MSLILRNLRVTNPQSQSAYHTSFHMSTPSKHIVSMGWDCVSYGGIAAVDSLHPGRRCSSDVRVVLNRYDCPFKRISIPNVVLLIEDLSLFEHKENGRRYHYSRSLQNSHNRSGIGKLRPTSSCRSVLSGFQGFSYILYRIIYNLYFHPLAKFPGPKRAAVSNVFYALGWYTFCP